MQPQKFRSKHVVEAMQVPVADDTLGWGHVAGWLGLVHTAAEWHVAGPADTTEITGVRIVTPGGPVTVAIGEWIVFSEGYFYRAAVDEFSDGFELEPNVLDRTLERFAHGVAAGLAVTPSGDGYEAFELGEDVEPTDVLFGHGATPTDAVRALLERIPTGGDDG